MSKLLFKFQQKREQEIINSMIEAQDMQMFDIDNLSWGEIVTFNGFNYDFTEYYRHGSYFKLMLILPNRGGVYSILENKFYPCLRGGLFKRVLEDNDVLKNKKICVEAVPLFEVLLKTHLSLPKSKKFLTFEEIKVVEDAINERLRTREIVFNNN